MRFKIIGKGTNKEEIEGKIELIKQTIQKNLKSYIYGYNNISLEETVINLLRERKLKLGICESCTGGLISHKLTSVAGASLVFDRAIISYSNNSKMEELNVKGSTLRKYGAVSRETALEMARGLFEKAKLDLALSITGIAGPSGGSEDKPIGRVYICVMDANKYYISKYTFNGNRNLIQKRASVMALNEIRKILMEYNID